jgi:hypothetical protein
MPPWVKEGGRPDSRPTLLRLPAPTGRTCDVPDTSRLNLSGFPAAFVAPCCPSTTVGPCCSTAGETVLTACGRSHAQQKRRGLEHARTSITHVSVVGWLVGWVGGRLTHHVMAGQQHILRQAGRQAGPRCIPDCVRRRGVVLDLCHHLPPAAALLAGGQQQQHGAVIDTMASPAAV